MKNIIAVITIVTLFSCTNAVHAQGKIGHVNAQELVQSLPEYKTAETTMQKFAQDMQQTDAAMQQEYQEKVAKYLKDSTNMTEPKKAVAKQDIEDLAKRIQTFEASSDQKMQEKQAELLKPIQEKVMKAVKEVAKESGYAYLFDTSNGSSLVYYPETDDMTEVVKKKIGGTGGQSTGPRTATPPKK